MSSEDRQDYRPGMLSAAHTDVSEYGQDVSHLEMIKRRQGHLGGSVLFYHEPVNIVRGQGVWLYDDKGKKYLDAYNNVPSVGHCHPAVVAALSNQARQLNTHTRYLHDNVIDYAEKLSGLMPEGLDICMFVCTGTEANELAMRIAQTVTGKQGAIVLEAGYHGNSKLIDELSMVAHPVAEDRPGHVVAVEPPNTYRGPYRAGEHDNLGKRYADLVDNAIAELERRGQGTAAFMADAIFDAAGPLCAPEDYFQHVYAKVRAAGGLCIADEVQSGLCRTGKWWGFEHYGVVPDIVTLGKPMGDGHPVAAVVTTREISEKFTSSATYFNTFGGNPVSAIVGKTVLDICEREKLARNCEEVGGYLKQRLEKLAERHPIIGAVHGHGLFLGIELVHDRVTREPARDVASLAPDAMKEQGVLMGVTGRFGNVLKVRPPLIFSRANADQLVAALDRVLGELVGAAGQRSTSLQVGTGAQRVDQGVLTERIIEKLASNGCQRIQVTPGVVITPLAKDRARSLNIVIERVANN